MDAKLVLQKIRQRGITIMAIGNHVSLEPMQLVNKRMVVFVKEYKNELLTILYQEKDDQKLAHSQKKDLLRPGRLEILRILLSRFLNNAECRFLVDYKTLGWVTDAMVEKYLDNELVQFNYELEDTIDFYRLIGGKILNNAVPPSVCKCGYRPPFCICNIHRNAVGTDNLLIEKR